MTAEERLSKEIGLTNQFQDRALKAEKSLAAAQQENQRLRDALTDLLSPVHAPRISRSPRVIDLCYTAFQLAKEPNKEDAGPSDWLTDTRPAIEAGLDKLRAEIALSGAQQEPAPPRSGE